MDREDLYRAQAALMAWVKQCGHCNYLHRGDVGHRLFNSCFGYDPADVMRYWLDDAGEICAFAVLDLPRGAFDLQVSPTLRLSGDHIELFEYCEGETLRLCERNGKRAEKIVVEGDDCDPAYIAFVEARGYSFLEHGFALTRHDLKGAAGRAAARWFPFPSGDGRTMPRCSPMYIVTAFPASGMRRVMARCFARRTWNTSSLS